MTFEEFIQEGIDRAKQGDARRALNSFLGAAAIRPDDPLPHNLIGKIYLACGRDTEGVDALVEAVRRDPSADLIFDLVHVLSNLLRYPDVEAVCRRHERQIAGDARFLPYRGMAQLQIGQNMAAVESLMGARDANPQEFANYHNLSIALLAVGRLEEAVECYGTLLPDWDGGAAETTTVERLDTIADGYDNNTLHNFFSDRILRLYLENLPGRRMRRVLELGTGTGLLGSKLPASASSVTGVERSPAMLAQARARKVYDTLVEGSLPDILDTLDGPYETIFASCVLYYFADLRPFFVQSARLLEPGGVFLFSVDPLSDPREIAVTKPGEYAHSRAYLRRMAAATGFAEVAIEIDCHRRPPGFWCAFRKG